MIDNAPIIEDLQFFGRNQLQIEFEKNEIPIARGCIIKFNRKQGSDDARLIINMKNAQLERKHTTPEELNTE